MPETQIILQEGQILLIQTTSQLSIVFDNSPFQNGEVVQVNDLEETYAVNDIVTYDPSGSFNLKSPPSNNRGSRTIQIKQVHAKVSW